jgi:hypothetical protein
MVANTIIRLLWKQTCFFFQKVVLKKTEVCLSKKNVSKLLEKQNGF